MLQNINPVTTQAWKKLEQHYEIMKNKHMIDLFAVDPDRFSNLSLHFENLLVDFSKNIITEQTLELLLELASRERTALMCAEAVWWRCHRALISDVLKLRGIEVVHILDATHAQAHPWTAPARIEDGRLGYPPVQPGLFAD